jgi:hypothetical protein
MRKALLLTCVFTTGYLAFLSVSPADSHQTNHPAPASKATQAAVQPALAGFLRSLDSDSVKKCLRLHHSGNPIDHETLVKCGNFSLYAKHQRLPEQYAIGHFKNILIHSSTPESLRAQLRESSQLVTPAFQVP